MKVLPVDERRLAAERTCGDFLLFIFYGGRDLDGPWAVDSRLMQDANLFEALTWLGENLPPESCWSLGVVRDPVHPGADSDLDVVWIVGADVMNMQLKDRSPEEQQIAEEMLVRRHRVTFL